MRQKGKPAAYKPVEVMLGRHVIRHSAASLTLGPSADDIMRSKKVTALKPGSQDVPDIGMSVLNTLMLGAMPKETTTTTPAPTYSGEDYR